MKRLTRLVLLISSIMLGTFTLRADPPPRLVVVVSFDQHRGDFFTSFRPHLGAGGFQRIAREGVVFDRCYYNHANNITGPGHAAILSGCYPWKTGIVGNDFCDTRTGICGYCADDTAGVKGAHKLEVPTVGDVLRIASPKSKVVGISLKDRASILMAGQGASACVWYDYASGGWTTSAAYAKPSWLSELRRTVHARRYAGAVWRTEIPDSAGGALDDVLGEGSTPATGGRWVFPYTLSADVKTDEFHSQIALSPFSMRMLFDAAILAAKRERLGSDTSPDLLCIGVSTPDYVGHLYGPDSREVQELYVHADREIERLINELDRRVGRSNYVLIVTSDHGVAPIPEVIRKAGAPQHAAVDAGRIRGSEIKTLITEKLTQHFGTPAGGAWVDHIMPPSIYLRDSALANHNRREVVDTVVAALRRHPHLAIVATPASLLDGVVPPGVDSITAAAVRRSMHRERSGDVVMYPKRYWIFGGTPATHGTPYDYDQWVPLMMLGYRISSDTPSAAVSPVDIAPTLARILGIALPNVDGRQLPITIK